MAEIKLDFDYFISNYNLYNQIIINYVDPGLFSALISEKRPGSSFK